MRNLWIKTKKTWELLENFLKESRNKEKNPAMYKIRSYIAGFLYLPNIAGFLKEAEIQAYVL